MRTTRSKTKKMSQQGITQPSSAQATSEYKKNNLSTIISAKTGLISKEDAVMRALPKSYNDRTIGDALDYLLQKKGLQDNEIPFAQSIMNEMKADTFVVIVNGKNAELTDSVADYIVTKKHELPDNQVKSYNALEIEISSVQEGGRYQL